MKIQKFVSKCVVCNGNIEVKLQGMVCNKCGIGYKETPNISYEDLHKAESITPLANIAKVLDDEMKQKKILNG